jgi:ubiquinol-cytochrome c reductase iron-sulfur subunit
MLLCAFAWFAWIVSGYMSQPNAPHGMSRSSVDLMGLTAGEYMIVRWNRHKFFVWHRTNETLARLRDYEDKLQDPNSLYSDQPAAAKNHYRSMDPRYLVVLADNGGGKDCEVEAVQPNRSDIPVSPWFGGFWNPCSGVYYDLAGRSYASGKRARNLTVPAHQVIAGKLYLEQE